MKNDTGCDGMSQLAVVTMTKGNDQHLVLAISK
jgi:hypothetical protein